MIKFIRILSIILALILISLLIYLIIRQFKDYYSSKDPVLLKLREEFEHALSDEKYFCGNKADCILKRQVNKRGGPRKCLSEISLHEGDKSYTINKTKVYLCLKDENGQYYDKNMLIYVLGHELAHVLCDEIGHTTTFHQIFDELLELLTIKGIYNPEKPLLQNYCNYS